MNLLNLYANGNLLTLGSHPMTTSGSVNFDTCTFNFNSEWKGFERTAVFATGDSVCYAVELDDTGVCKIPGECLKKTGILKIGVVGENSDGVVISTNIVVQRIVEGANNSEVSFVPVNPETGEEDDGILSDESAIHLLWQDSSFELGEEFRLDDYSSVDETDIHSVYNVCFSALAEKYPSYVTANVEGQDYSGNDIMSFTFTGTDYDRTVIITANHFASGYMPLRALSSFFRNLCENYKKDANLNFLHSKVKFVVLPVACPEALFSKSKYNSNGYIPFVNYDYFFEDSPIEDKGDCSFSEPETIPVISLLDIANQENCVWYFDFECDDFDWPGKKIYYQADSLMNGNFIQKIANDFDDGLDQSDAYSLTHIIETNTPIATNYATNQYAVNACTVVWADCFSGPAAVDSATEKYARFIGSFILKAVSESNKATYRKISPFVKQIIWKGNEDNNFFKIGSSCQPIWISGYSCSTYGVYNITLKGFITVISEAETRVKVKPVLYQVNSPTDDFESRFDNNLFDVEVNVPAGRSVIPFQSVLCAKSLNASSETGVGNVGAVVAAASPGDIKATSVSYIFEAVPAEKNAAVEVLTPPGRAADYTDATTTPVFKIAYPEMYHDII